MDKLKAPFRSIDCKVAEFTSSKGCCIRLEKRLLPERNNRFDVVSNKELSTDKFEKLMQRCRISV